MLIAQISLHVEADGIAPHLRAHGRRSGHSCELHRNLRGVRVRSPPHNEYRAIPALAGRLGLEGLFKRLDPA